MTDLPGPPGLPLIGNALQLDPKKLHTTLAGWADRYGEMYRFRIARQACVAVSDAGVVADVLRRRPAEFRRWNTQIIRELGVDGVFNAEGDDWRRQRALTMFALNPNHLRGYFARLAQVTERLRRVWTTAATEGRPVDAQRDLMRFTVDVTSGLAFGNDLNTLEETGDAIQSHLEKIFPSLIRRMLAPVPYWRYVTLPADRELKRSFEEVRRLVDELIASRRDRSGEEAAREAGPRTFLDGLLGARADGGERFSDLVVFGNVLTLLLAGEDTTANTLAWMMHLMVEHPDVQANVRREADAALGDLSVAADYETTDRLAYVEAVAHEAMRMKPVAPLIAVEAVADTTVGGCAIPADTTVFLLTGHAAMQERNFGSAREFRPERWLEQARVQHPVHDAKSSMPFGAGPRFCPGRHLAMLEIKMAVAMLCRNFVVERATGAPPVREEFAFTMMPRNVLVRLSRR